ncbi:citron Rho-interacting kinase-like isoform X2 [Gigantopelta aegis]|uniref:citron Rho-interacting kinase-like isoform X2 n=1 Tax=Gigantopelta aegis TaxID=1735272 RepID=UPI001B88BB16|nr:citron Rho-interacting kinase-like isoform X2 [Gigantopelta aegis]
MSEEEGKVDGLEKRLAKLYQTSFDRADRTTYTLSSEELFDGFLTLYDECTHDNLARDKNVKNFIRKYHNAICEVEALKLHASDFEVKDVIGRGHFGVVQVVHEKVSDLVFAMKVLRKQDILSQPEISFYEEERDIMATTTSPWITHLHYAFQDAVNLYLVMDFHPGGDLLSLLSRHDDKFDEDMAVVYLAEIAVAINDLHEMGYVHRDIKPENILLDQTGHIKLADFGSAAKLDKDNLVSSHLPVGTPDYVAPELLTSLNTNCGAKLYGVEVDWWSLGVCAYEMLFGKTPFTDDYGSMVTTYSNIMQFKTKLTFPDDCNVSKTAKDFIQELLTDSDSRLKWKTIKTHSFFGDIKWDDILQKTPPFVPTISSLDDTSNFEDVEKVKRPATLNDHKVHRDFTGLDLPFVGFTFVRTLAEKGLCRRETKTLTQTVINEYDGDRSYSTAVQTLCSDSPNVEVTLTVKVSELRNLREQCCQMEQSQSEMKADVRRLSLESREKDHCIVQINIEKEALERELEFYVTKTKTLAEQLNIELEDHNSLEKQGQGLWQQIIDMNSEVKHIEDEITLTQADELRDIIIQLEADNENLLRELNQKRRNLASCNKTLEETQKQLSHMQLKLDKERRKSRESQKRDIALMENRDDLWNEQLQEKHNEIKELVLTIQNLEDLVEAYEDQEREHASEIEQLHQKMNSSFRENMDSSWLPPVEKSESTSSLKPKRLELHVTLKSGRPSMLHSTKTIEKIKELEKLIDKYDQEARTWRQKEEMMKRVIKQMSEENKHHTQKSEASQKKKESLIQHMKLYQQEVQDQKSLIKELQATMQNSLESKTQELQYKTKKIDELSALVTDLQEKAQDYKLSEERNKRAEEHIEQLIAERKQLDNKMCFLEEKISSLNKELEEKCDQILHAERRLADAKSEIQQLYQQKTDLQVVVESLQKVASSKDEQLKEKGELNSKINQLLKSNSDLQKAVNKYADEKNILERKLKKHETELEELKQSLKKFENAEKDNQDLKRKISRLEHVEKEKVKADEKLFKLVNVEAEKRDLDKKLAKLEKLKKEAEEKLEGVEKNKQELEKKVKKEKKEYEENFTKLEKEKEDLMKQIVKLDTVEAEKKELEKRIKKLGSVEKDKRLSEKCLKSVQNEKSDLENQILKLRTENDSLKQRIVQYEKLEQDQNITKEKLLSLERENKSLEKQVKDQENLKTEKRNLEEKLSKLERAETEKQDLEKKLTELEAMEMLKMEVEERLVCVEEEKQKLERIAQKEKEEFEEDLLELRKEKDDLSEKILKLETVERERKQLESKLKTLENLEKDKRKSDASLKSIQTEKSDLENQIAKLQRENDKMKERIVQYEKSEQKHIVTKEKLSGLEKEKKLLEKQVKEMQNLKIELKSLEQKLQKLEKDYSQSTKQNQNLNQKLDKFECLQRKNSDLEKKFAELESVQKQNESLQKLVCDLESKKKQDLEKLSNKLEQLEKENQDLSKKLEKIEKEKQELSKKVEHLEKEKQELSKKVEPLEKEKQELSKKVEHLEKEKQELSKKVEHLEKDNKALSVKLENLEREQRDLSKKLECLEKEKQELSKKLECLEKEKQELSKKLEDLENEKQKLQTQLKEHEKASSGKSENLSADSRRSLVDKLLEEKLALQQRIESLEAQKEEWKRTKNSDSDSDLRKVKEELEEKVKWLEGTTTELEKEMDKKKDVVEENSKLKKEKLVLQGKIDSMSDEVQSLKSVLDKLKTNSSVDDCAKDNEITKVRNSLKRTKSFAVGSDQKVEDLHQEKRYLEAKVNSLQKHMEQLQGSSSQCGQLECAEQEKLDLASQLEQLQKTCDSLKTQVDELQSLREVNQQLETQIKQLEAKTKQPEKDDTTFKNSRLGPSCGVSSEMQRELLESNLALSEARSLLSASKRQEHELKEQIRSLQRQLDNKSMEAGPRIQNTKSVENELRLVKSQCDMVQRQNKTLQENNSSLQKAKGGEKLEVMTLRDQLKAKEQQYALEIKKSAKYQGICAELEEQLQDLEYLVAEYEKREAEWGKIRQSFEQAMQNREDELEGRSQTVNAMEKAKNATGERLTQTKQQLQSVKASHKADIEELNHKLWDERNTNKKLKNKLEDITKKLGKMEMVLETQTKTIEVHIEEKNYLKEEISKILTKNQEVRSENLRLKKNLDEAMNKFELIFGEKIDLENFTEAMQGLHFLEKYKFESTIGQQMKLIDYLQALWLENIDKKKKKGSKLFGSVRSKDCAPGIPPQWKDFQASLEAERKKNAKLQEQIDKLREENFQQANELLKLNGPLHEKLIFDKVNTPKVHAAVVALSHSPANQPSPSRILSSSSSYRIETPRTPKPTKQRMHHNIPHRFVQGLNTRATKCAVCLGSVNFVKQASKCDECHMVCHPRCVSSVPASCGLPTEYIQQYTDMMEKISFSYSVDVLDNTDYSIKLDGWLKVHVSSSKSAKSSWERRWVALDNTWLLIYLTDKDANPVDTFELNPKDVEVSIHSAILPTELSNTVATDVAHVLRLDQDPVTTCWPGRVLYLMAETFVDKQKWVASLEAAVKNVKRGESFQKNRLQMTTALSIKEKKELNCSLVLSKQCVLIGCEEGLFAWNPQQGDKLIQLTGLGSVHYMCLASTLGMIIIISGQDRHLLMVEKKLVKLRLSQTTGGETVPLPTKMVDKIIACTVVDVTLWQDSTYLCVGMTDRIVIMKYNLSLGMFCTRKELMMDEPCSCVCIAENMAIVGAEKFYKISLEHPTLIDFVDRQDSSLAYTLFSASNHQSFPLAVVQVSPGGLPLEFLLCFHEFGVFVDDKGHRSRPLDVKWSGLPLAFAYREPFLYITYFNSVQATVIPADKGEVKGRKTIIDVHSPRYMGVAIVPGAVYVAACMRDSVDMLCIRGQEEHSQVISEKENRLIESFKKADKLQVRFATPQKETRRQLSQTSLNSNTSDSTTTTESDL